MQFVFIKLNTESEKRPINFAIESFCKSNLAALLLEPTVNIDLICSNPEWSGKTPINFLASRVNDGNFNEVLPCIKILVENFANVNVPDNGEMSPILYVNGSEDLNDGHKNEILTYLLANAVDIDGEEWNFERLKQCLQERREDEFVKGLNHIELNETIFCQCFESSPGCEVLVTLLTLAIRRVSIKAVQRMLRLGADINFKPPGQSMYSLTPIEHACQMGSWQILNIFLRSSKINVHTNPPLVFSAVQNWHIKSLSPKNGVKFEDEVERSKKCLQVLLNSPKIDIDQPNEFGQTALDYSLINDLKEITTELLKNGAYIGNKDCFSCSSLPSSNPYSFKDYLDGCVSRDYNCPIGLSENQKFYNICFDYKNLVPPSFKRSREIPVSWFNEMELFKDMSDTKELRPLLKHPFIQCFLFLKWQRLTLIFYLNIFAHFIFTATFCSYILSCYFDLSALDLDILNHLLWISSWITFAILVMRELFQFIFASLYYRKTFRNYCEIVLLFAVAFTLWCFDVTNNTHRAIAALVMFLLVIELFVLLGSLEIFSIHFSMLKTVVVSFIKGFALYVIILIAFALCFFALLKKSSTNNLTADQNGTEDEENGGISSFDSVELSLLKVFVMLTGEFDTGSINFDANPFSYFIFVLFLFAGPMALLNLLNGLAISDIQVLLSFSEHLFEVYTPHISNAAFSFQEIRSDAELTYLVRRVHLLSRYEKILCVVGPNSWW